MGESTRMYHSLYHHVAWSKKLGEEKRGFRWRQPPPATPRHTMFPLWLLPSGPDQGGMQACSQYAETLTACGLMGVAYVENPTPQPA